MADRDLNLAHFLRQWPFSRQMGAGNLGRA
jgi:hypothetical protein